ncbi:MAG: GspE/PulE family protein [Candidatus Paceibacterota bacterium]|nr:MAG: GspE/PulE family protein [Candidatus Paceibacterota bacterium]
MAKFQEEKQNLKIEELRKSEAEELAQTLSSKYGLSYIDLTISPINIEALKILSEKDARAFGLAVFDVINKRLKIGILAPNNLKSREMIESLKRKGYQIELYMVSQEGLNRAWERYADLHTSVKTRSGALDISNEGLLSLIKNANSLDSIKQLVEKNLVSKEINRTSKILEVILAGALSIKASDIHLEPEENYVRLRFRLDGVLTDILNFDNATYKLLLSRIKLLSGLKLNITSQAQDGRFSIILKDEEIEIRTSILPGAYAETIVLRILNPKAISVSLENLGMHPRLLKVLLYEISKPNGMILTTGPTGSGKTTTLYAFLKKIHQPGIKIITIENPIEYHLPGIVQTQTDNKEGYTFLSGLRSALRQDPDVIMVGEIRDSETASVAINAALTGHLVFSTLHTNNAAGTFPRLIDLKINPKVITSAINVAMAQRLVRRLCPKCRKVKKLSGQERSSVLKILESIKEKSYLENLQTENVWETQGCKECNFTGFAGRVGVYEAIRTDEKVEGVIQNNPSEREIKKAAENQGLLTMAQDGIIKVFQGVTSIAELERVVELLE